MVVDSSIPCKLFRILIFISCLVSNFYFKWHCNPVLHIILVLSCNHCYFYQLSCQAPKLANLDLDLKNLMYSCTCKVIVFKKVRFQNAFCPHENEKPVFLKFLWCEKCFWMELFLWQISMDSRPKKLPSQICYSLDGAWV